MIKIKYDRNDQNWSCVVGDIPEEYLNWFDEFKQTGYDAYIKPNRLFEQCMNAAVVVAESTATTDDSSFQMICRSAAYSVISALRNDNPENEVDNSNWIMAWTYLGIMVRECYFYIMETYKGVLPINFSIHRYNGHVFKANVLTRTV